MHRPGRLLAIQTEPHHEQPALGFRALEKKFLAAIGENQRQRLGRAEARMWIHFDVEQVAVIRGKKRVKDRMVRENELKLFGALACGIRRGLSLKTKLAQEPRDGRRDPIDE